MMVMAVVDDARVHWTTRLPWSATTQTCPPLSHSIPTQVDHRQSMQLDTSFTNQPSNRIAMATKNQTNIVLVRGYMIAVSTHKS